MSPELALDEITLISNHYGDPRNNSLTLEIANCYILHGRYNSGLEVLEAGNRDDYYITRRIADCYILLGSYSEAHEALVHLIELGTRYQMLIDDIWSLKLIAGDKINGKEILTLLGPQLTDFGKANLQKIRECLDFLLETYERENNINLIEVWAADAHSYMGKIETGNVATEVSLRGYSFGRYESVIQFVKQITRLAENIVREKFGIPMVGKGWLSETQLYHEIRNALSDYDVEQHYSPYWLGRQHLDVFIHELNIALEYQGRQHDEPIDFFGGQQAHEQNKERDARKKRLCEMYGVHIVYVRPGYNFVQVLREVMQHTGLKIEFDDQEEADSIYMNIDKHQNELLQIDAKGRPKPVRFEYKLDPEYQVEPIQFDLTYKISLYKVRRHKSLSDEIRATYKQRNEDPCAIDKVIELCRKQIALSFDIAQYEYQDRVSRRDRCLQAAEANADDLVERRYNLQAAERIMQYPYDQTGYQRLVMIYQKQHKYEEALKYVLKAKAECWNEAHDWDKRVFELSTRIKKQMS